MWGAGGGRRPSSAFSLIRLCPHSLSTLLTQVLIIGYSKQLSVLTWLVPDFSDLFRPFEYLSIEQIATFTVRSLLVIHNRHESCRAELKVQPGECKAEIRPRKTCLYTLCNRVPPGRLEPAAVIETRARASARPLPGLNTELRPDRFCFIQMHFATLWCHKNAFLKSKKLKKTNDSIKTSSLLSFSNFMRTNWDVQELIKLKSI